MTADGFLLLLLIVGDTGFQAQRRAWSQAASRAGVTNFGYLFTQPQPAAPARNFGGKIRCSHLSSLVPLFTRIGFASVPRFRTLLRIRCCKRVRRSKRHICSGVVASRYHARLLDLVRLELGPQ